MSTTGTARTTHPRDRAPATATTVPAALGATAARQPDATAFADEGGALTWRALADAVDRVAAGLIAADVAHGDRLATVMPNGRDFVTLALAAWSVGATLVPVNTRFTPEEIAHVLGRTTPTLVATTDGFLGRDFADTARGAVRAAGLTAPVLDTAPAADPRHGPTWQSLLEAGAGTDPGRLRERRAAVTRDTPSDILMTSGTSGSARAVVATHGQTTHGFGQWARSIQLGPEDTQLVLLPMFQGFGLKAGLVASVLCGAAIVTAPRFHPADAVRAMERHGVSVVAGSPTLHAELLRAHRERSSAARLRAAVVGTAFVPPELAEGMREIADHVVTGYGLTECCGPISMNGVGATREAVATTVGRPLGSLDIRIDTPAPAGDDAEPSGEILVRGYCVMRADGSDTASPVDADGWLHTGDIGTLGPDGLLRLVGRKKEMFIVGGFNVYPRDVESVLERHPDVQESVVVGAPDARLGEVGRAYVLRTTAGTATAEELLAWCAGRLANYKVPREVRFVADFPRTPLGKVVRSRLA